MAHADGVKDMDQAEFLNDPQVADLKQIYSHHVALVFAGAGQTLLAHKISIDTIDLLLIYLCIDEAEE